MESEIKAEEKLAEVKAPEVKEQLIEQPKVEIKEQLKEEPKVEVKEALKEEVKVEVKEQLSTEKLREQLSVIKQTREELTKVYSEIEALNKESLSLRESNKKLEENSKILTLEKESLSNSLKVSEEKLTKIDEEMHIKRLEKLSASFKDLGQTKTVEQLHILPKAIITEFEEIVKAGLSAKKESEKLSIPVTQPSQAMPAKKEEKLEARKPVNMFEAICKGMAKEQGKEGVFNNKTVRSL